MSKKLDEQARLKRLARAEKKKMGPICESKILSREMKDFIRKRDKYTCQNPECGMSEDLYERSYFEIHHIDYDKENNKPWNLILLCMSCHFKTFVKKTKRIWTNFYTAIMKQRGLA